MVHTTFSFATFIEADNFFNLCLDAGIGVYMDAIQTMFGFTVWVDEPFRERAIEIFTRP